MSVRALPSIPEQISAAAAAQPERAAIQTSTLTVSYRDFERQVGKLAAFLRDAGVSVEVPVAVCLHRSVERIITIVAALRAGGSFIPLDPDWPLARLQALLRDSGAHLVVAEPEMADRLDGDYRAISLDRDSAEIACCEPLAAAPRQPTDLAYVIYTSGSSGEPKAVEITDGNLLNLIDWHRREFEICPDDRASHLAGLGFDAAIWEVLPYLCAGASVMIPAETTRYSAESLRQWLIDQKVTMAFLPSSLAEPMIAAPWPEPPALRYLLTGAETLHRAPAPGLGFTVVNNYGPTECAVVATSSAIPPETAGLPSIGRPISNVQVHLLGENGEPVPDDELGEIHIGGSGVGRGYRNRPTLTAERFLRDTISSSGGRLYRTGDLGRRGADGQILFCGRVDDQVKIRGHRIEPDEIVQALNRHERVGASVVIASATNDGTMQLIAYVVPRTDEPSAEELRDHLAAFLPDFMIPHRFLRLDALPLTTSGKVDKRALPAPSAENALGSARHQGPRTPVERILMTIFREALGETQIGIHESFFLSGGHSLLGTQVVLRARDAFGVELTLRDIFEAQTVARLASTIERLAFERVNAMSEEEAERRVAL